MKYRREFNLKDEEVNKDKHIKIMLNKTIAELTEYGRVQEIRI